MIRQSRPSMQADSEVCEDAEPVVALLVNQMLQYVSTKEVVSQNVELLTELEQYQNECWTSLANRQEQKRAKRKEKEVQAAKAMVERKQREALEQRHRVKLMLESKALEHQMRERNKEKDQGGLTVTNFMPAGKPKKKSSSRSIKKHASVDTLSLSTPLSLVKHEGEEGGLKANQILTLQTNQQQPMSTKAPPTTLLLNKTTDKSSIRTGNARQSAVGRGLWDKAARGLHEKGAEKGRDTPVSQFCYDFDTYFEQTKHEQQTRDLQKKLAHLQHLQLETMKQERKQKKESLSRSHNINMMPLFNGAGALTTIKALSEAKALNGHGAMQAGKGRHGSPMDGKPAWSGSTAIK